MDSLTGRPNGGHLSSALRLITINLVVTLCMLEVALRIQQRLGPFYDLDIRHETLMVELSDELNHVPVPGRDWDRNGLRRIEEPNAAQCSQRILFMGDSFMEGILKTPNGDYIPARSADTVPYHVRLFFRQSSGHELCIFNAGYASYSPSIFVPQAKKLIPLVKPDVVVIDVDETDMWDDYYRYRGLVTRDGDGSITAVRTTPLAPINLRFHRGLLESTNKTFYVHRLLSKLYFTRIEFPEFLSHASQQRLYDNLALAKLPAVEARQNHQAEIEYFKATLEDLTQTVSSRLGRPARLVFIHHPHLEHLQTTGVVFNNVVAATLQDVSARNGVRYYDATDDLKKEFGSGAQNYYIPNDMHFNLAGTRAYGTAVAKYLAATSDRN